MAKDNEKKDLEQLMNSMFRGHRLNTVSAEDYLEQVKKSQNEVQTGLDQAQSHQKQVEDTLSTTENAVDQLNAILHQQSEDLQRPCAINPAIWGLPIRILRSCRPRCRRISGFRSTSRIIRSGRLRICGPC